MSKRKKNIDIDSEIISQELLKHLQRLRLRSVEKYKEWCKSTNHSCERFKTVRQLDREVAFFVKKKASEALRVHNKEKKLSLFITELYRKEIRSSEVNDGVQKELFEAFRESSRPKILKDSLLYLDRHARLLKAPELIAGVIALVKHFPSWIRPLEQWKPKSHNRERRFFSLVRHLLARYDVPVFMDQGFIKKNRRHQEWFIHLGSGQNIRTAAKLPLPLSKRMAHYFLAAPGGYTIEEALRWGQVHGLGGDKRLMEALRETRLATEFNNNHFWESVIRFFIGHPMLDTVHVNPIVDYIWNQKCEDRMLFVARGVAENQGPEQPNFSMTGRTPETLLRQVEQWHHRLGVETRAKNFQWSHSHLKDFEWLTGNQARKNIKAWRIRELVSSAELVAEGRALHHCVASYAASCKFGRSTIWSMTLRDVSGTFRLLTIEVSSKGQICQIRGLRNRRATEHEKNIILRWADKEKLQMAKYV